MVFQTTPVGFADPLRGLVQKRIDYKASSVEINQDMTTQQEDIDDRIEAVIDELNELEAERYTIQEKYLKLMIEKNDIVLDDKIETQGETEFDKFVLDCSTNGRGQNYDDQDIMTLNLEAWMIENLGRKPIYD
jgi:hypothetical protein